MLMIEDGNGEASGRDRSDAVESTIGGGAAAIIRQGLPRVATLRNRAHIVPMADTSPPPPVVQIKESKDGTWDVTVSWHSGRTERLGNFQTEPEARGANPIY
jgi:hypothetical protein